jgi:flagellar motor switch protein FliG
MPINEDSLEERIPGIRKAAILMVALGDDASSAIMRELEEEEIQQISQAIARVKSVTKDETRIVLDEFYQMAIARNYVVRGGVDYARKVLMNALGPDQAKRMLDKLMKSLGNETLSFDALQKADPQQLAKFIHSEHPQTIALVLSHLNASQAGGLLMSLPSELRADVALRMASLDQISPEIITKIATVIGHKLKALGEISRESYGGVESVAEMFNRLDSNTSKEILEDIEAVNPKLVEGIRHLMFVFEDLLMFDVNSIKEILTRVDRKILTIALKGTSEAMKNHMLQAMSQRGADMMREDMDALGAIKIKEVEAAQQQIIGVVRQLEADGTVSMKAGGGNEYVS